MKRLCGELASHQVRPAALFEYVNERSLMFELAKLLPEMVGLCFEQFDKTNSGVIIDCIHLLSYRSKLTTFVK